MISLRLRFIQLRLQMSLALSHIIELLLQTAMLGVLASLLKRQLVIELSQISLQLLILIQQLLIMLLMALRQILNMVLILALLRGQQPLLSSLPVLLISRILRFKPVHCLMEIILHFLHILLGLVLALLQEFELMLPEQLVPLIRALRLTQLLLPLIHERLQPINLISQLLSTLSFTAAQPLQLLLHLSDFGLVLSLQIFILKHQVIILLFEHALLALHLARLPVQIRFHFLQQFTLLIILMLGGFLLILQSLDRSLQISLRVFSLLLFLFIMTAHLFLALFLQLIDLLILELDLLLLQRALPPIIELPLHQLIIQRLVLQSHFFQFR